MLSNYTIDKRLCRNSVKIYPPKNDAKSYKDNVHKGKVGYETPGSRSLTLIHTDVVGTPRCFFFSSKKSNLSYQRSGDFELTYLNVSLIRSI